jgi:hypothetical protein
VKPLEIYRQAVALGLKLEPAGERLLVFGESCPPDFVQVLHQNKRELLDLLETKSANLTSDCAPWLHIARQVLAGEFDGADRSTRESLTLGLRGICHPLCQQALARIKATGRQDQ